MPANRLPSENVRKEKLASEVSRAWPGERAVPPGQALLASLSNFHFENFAREPVCRLKNLWISGDNAF